MNNLRKKEVQFDNPIVNIIMKYDTRQEGLWCLVPDKCLYPIFKLNSDNLSNLVFFGYKEQCERQWLRFPNTKIIELVLPIIK